MRAHWKVAAPLVPVVAALALAACGGDDVDPGPEPAEAASDGGTQVSAKMGHEDSGEFSFTLDKTSAPAGAVVFNIENVGEVEHEFEIVKTDLAADALPVEANKADVEAGGGEEIDEVEDIAVGAKVALEVDLEPGKYLIVCNLPGHYADGMVIPFEVT